MRKIRQPIHARQFRERATRVALVLLRAPDAHARFQVDGHREHHAFPGLHRKNGSQPRLGDTEAFDGDDQRHVTDGTDAAVVGNARARAAHGAILPAQLVEVVTH